MKVEERAFTLEEMRGAREAFVTGAGALIMPVVNLDGPADRRRDSRPGGERLRALYIQKARETAC